MTAMSSGGRVEVITKRGPAYNFACFAALAWGILLVSPPGVRGQLEQQDLALGPVSDLGFLPPQAQAGTVALFANRADVLDLEAAIAQAELILAVRLVDVSETKIVHGGRNVEITQQYRFEPVRVLKGIFARDELLMTGQDLGIYRFAEGADRLQRGQLMLVMLGRQGEGYINCCVAPTLGQSIPRLDGMDDPLLAAVNVLVGMTRQRDRVVRVDQLRDGLKKANGRDAMPLLLALGRRAYLAARAPEMAGAILPKLKANSSAIREVTARTLSALLETIPERIPLEDAVRNRPEPREFQTEAAGALAALIAEPHPDLAARVAAIDALGAAGGVAIEKTPVAVTWLTAEKPASTFAEAGARLRVQKKLVNPKSQAEVVRFYESLLLDAPVEIQEIAGQTLLRLDAARSSELISARLARKAEAGLDVALEIRLLGELSPQAATSELLKVRKRPLNYQERLAFAKACANVADNRLVPVVSNLLDPRQWEIRSYAMEALRKIDTDEAASALWPHVNEEADLSRKLRLIAFLGRHGFRDGYPQALEHLSQTTLREEAVTAIAALDFPKAIPELQRIWQTSNDLAWNAAAIRALARLGQQNIAPKLLEIARTPGDPLASSALIGLGDLGVADALPIAREGLNSRSDEMVIASARAAASLLARPNLKDEVVRDRLAAILADANASHRVRHSALMVLTALKDVRLESALDLAVRDANLEGTPLLQAVERALKMVRQAPNTPVRQNKPLVAPGD